MSSMKERSIKKIKVQMVVNTPNCTYAETPVFEVKKIVFDTSNNDSKKFLKVGQKVVN